jgi:hypothetical protein
MPPVSKGLGRGASGEGPDSDNLGRKVGCVGIVMYDQQHSTWRAPDLHDRKIAVVRPVEVEDRQLSKAGVQTPMVHLLLLLRPHWFTDRLILFEVTL